MDNNLADIRKRAIGLMKNTADTLAHIAQGVSQQQATTLRDRNDGDKGWTVLEVVCHLRDFDGFFRGRAQRILNEETPQFVRYDHEALAIEHNYNGQDLGMVLAELRDSRAKTVAFFEGLAPESWERAGVHPERGHFTMTDAALQVGMHDVTHLEQITRILAEG
jgi:hypothetical protein